jgi:hypothetical protein
MRSPCCAAAASGHAAEKCDEITPFHHSTSSSAEIDERFELS